MPDPAVPAPPAAPAPAAPAAAPPAPPPAAAAPAEPAAPPPAAPAAPAAPPPPAKYDLKVPDGGYVDDSDLVRVEALAKTEGWSNEQAQEQLDRYAKGVQAQADAWLTETKADPIYGGDKLAESQKRGRAVIDRVRPDGHPRRDAFLRILNKTGYGNHPEVVAFFADLGKLAAEDQPAGEGAGSGGPKDAASVLYPTSATT